MDMVKVGAYAFAKELVNGEWRLYVGRWSNQTSRYGRVTGLGVVRDGGHPIKFVSFWAVKEYAEHRAL